MQTGKYLDIKAAALFLGRTEKAIYRLRQKGKLRAHKPDGKLMFERTELERFVGGE